MIITLIPALSPITPVTTVLALVFVLGVTAIKDAYEDFNRYRADKAVNNRVFHVVGANGVPVPKLAHLLRVGDVIELMEDDPAPADLLLLASSSRNDEGSAYIETAQLDGETNLKRRVAPECTSKRAQTRAGVGSLSGSVECEPPHHQIYDFKARLSIDGEEAASAGIDQLLQRGVVLRNTAWVRCLVVYCGADSKLSLNARPAPSKFSQVETKVNQLIAMIFVFKILLCIALTVGNLVLSSNERWYLAQEDDGVIDTVAVFFSYFALMSYLIPISLMVAFELAKMAQALFMYWDNKMRNDNGRTVAKTSNLNDELALVRWVFSDKTGTLTENRMDFSRASVRGLDVHAEDNSAIFDAISVAAAAPIERPTDKKQPPKKEKKKKQKKKQLDEQVLSTTADDIRQYLLCMSLCHTIVVQLPDDGNKETGDIAIDAVAEEAKSVRKSHSSRRSHHHHHHHHRHHSDKHSKKSKKKKGKKKSNSSSSSSSSDDDDDDEPELISPKKKKKKSNGLPDKDFVMPQYSGESPDEVALCQAAARNGYAYMGGSQSTMELLVRDPSDNCWYQEVYERLATLPFSSDRRRMSVIVRTPDSEVWLLCKGADYVVAHHLESSTSQALRDATVADLNEFSQLGLRTLMLGGKKLSAKEYSGWAKRWHKASTRIDEGQDEALDKLMTEIEDDMRLLGCTAIEDALQEYVPETIAYLLRANIRVWVITGDKQETAINIGFSSNLLKTGAPLVTLNATTAETCGVLIDEALAKYGAGVLRLEDSAEAGVPDDDLALVIDGNTLAFALSKHRANFLKLALRAKAVLACRVTPLGKSRAVELIKYASGDVTLSIGDGANDVSMIQAANVGVGIFGREGGQAARASDYALRQFSHLRRLITVHGRYSLLRNAGLVNYFLYKNMALVFVQALYSLRSGFSAQTIYDDWLLTMYNLFYTAAPPFFYAIMEKDVSEEALERTPELNRQSQRGKAFGYRTAIQWLALGIMHGCVLYYAAVLFFPDSIYDGRSGRLGGMFAFGTAMGTAGLIMVLLQAAIITKYWTWVVWVGHALSILGFVAVSLLQERFVDDFPTMFHMYSYVWGQPTFWLYLIIVAMATIVPGIGVRYFTNMLWPTEADLVREHDIIHGFEERERRVSDVGMSELKEF